MNQRAPLGESKNKHKIKQTKSLRAMADPAVRAELAQLKRDWKSLPAPQKALKLDQKTLDDVSNYDMGEALGLSEAIIRQYRKPRRERPVVTSTVTETDEKHASQNPPSSGNESIGQKNPRSRDMSRRVAAVMVSFFKGRNGAPRIRAKDVKDVLVQTEIRFSSEMHEPVQRYLPDKVSVAEVIRRTKPKPKPLPEWEVKYDADWLASIMISMTQDRNVRVRALECVRKKVDITKSPTQLLRKRSVPDPRDAPGWDDLNSFEQEFRMRRWLQS